MNCLVNDKRTGTIKKRFHKVVLIMKCFQKKHTDTVALAWQNGGAFVLP